MITTHVQPQSQPTIPLGLGLTQLWGSPIQRRSSLHKQAAWGMWDRLKLAPVLFYETLKLIQTPILFVSHQYKHQVNCHWENPLLNLKTP
jgi:hypothetical protein